MPELAIKQWNISIHAKPAQKAYTKCVPQKQSFHHELHMLQTAEKYITASVVEICNSITYLPCR